MLRRPLFLVLAAALATLLLSSRAQAWGGASLTSTQVGPGGVSVSSGRAHWDPYKGEWVGGRFGYGPTPTPSYARYGSSDYAFYGGYLDDGVYAAGYRTGVWGPSP